MPDIRKENQPAALPHGEPCVVVIFGAPGDLTKRKLMPALFHLTCSGCLADNFLVIGVVRKPMDVDTFRNMMRDGVEHSREIRAFSEEEWLAFMPRLDYLVGGFDDPDTCRRLAGRLARIEGPVGANRLFYLATSPSVAPVIAPVIVGGLAQAGLNRKENGWSRIVVEKPFGSDLASARVPIAMEPPVAFDTDAVRDKKTEVWRSIRPRTPEQVARHTVRAQYLSGTIDGANVPGYREETGASPVSHTETYTALEFAVDNGRWAGVPFYLRTGKRLARHQRVSELLQCLKG